MRIIDADLLLNDLPCKRAMSTCLNIDVCHGYNSCMDSVTKCIKRQPTVNEWIPCSERLPTENDHYLVTHHRKSYGNYLPLFDDVYVRKMRFQNNKWMFPFNLDKEAREDEFQEVIAWQPLPEPYEVQNESR